jgi:hypothetical protein
VRRALGSKLVGVYDGMPPHAPRSAALEAAAQARDAGCDLIVGIGGGSIIDAGKIVAMCLEHDLREHDEMEPFHVFVNEQGQVIKPSSSAAEDPRDRRAPPRSRAAQFQRALRRHRREDQAQTRLRAPDDGADQRHPLIRRSACTRRSGCWLSTGVRSADHALETLGSFESNDFCDGMADRALRLLAEGMPRVKANPHDLEARVEVPDRRAQSTIPIIGGTPMGASHAIGHILGGSPRCAARLLLLRDGARTRSPSTNR